jgi:hypothetical protein
VCLTQKLYSSITFAGKGDFPTFSRIALVKHSRLLSRFFKIGSRPFLSHDVRAQS